MTRNPRRRRPRPASKLSDAVMPEDAQPQPPGRRDGSANPDGTRLPDLVAVDAPESTDDSPLAADLEASLWFG